MLSIRRQWLLWFVLVTLNIAVAPVSRAQFSGFVKPADWGPYNGSVSGSYSTVYRGDYCGGGGGSGSHPGADIFRDRFGADFTAQTQIRAIYAATVVRKTLD